MSSEDKKKLIDQLDALKLFPNNKLVQQLRKQIQSKLENIEKKTEEEMPQVIESNTNRSRSSKLKKYHRYLRMIRDSFPNLKYNEIRKQFSERRKGQETDIPDVIWQNPSP